MLLPPPLPWIASGASKLGEGSTDQNYSLPKNHYNIQHFNFIPE
jgi:hypothetical protein